MMEENIDQRNPEESIALFDNRMSEDDRQKFININARFADRFTRTPGRYNGAWGPVDNSIKFTTPPVQTSKVTSPNYSQDMKENMVLKMNELIDAGVLIRPEELGLTVEFLSPSILVPKPDGTWRLVTDFTMLNRIIQRDASSSPTINDAKLELTRKKFRCELDLSNYYFQHGLRREDAAFLGIQHPTRGTFVYASSPQGLMNSAEKAYGLLGRIFGDMIEEGRLTRVADSVYPLGDSMKELARKGKDEGGIYIYLNFETLLWKNGSLYEIAMIGLVNPLVSFSSSLEQLYARSNFYIISQTEAKNEELFLILYNCTTKCVIL